MTDAAALGRASDWFGYAEALTGAEKQALARLRTTVDSAVRPVVGQHWDAATFPAEAGEALVALDLMRPAEVLADWEEPSQLYAGFRTFELARADASMATWYNAQSGLVRTLVELGGDQAQRRQLLPRILSFEQVGAFALTEPDHGSDIAGGMETTAVWDESAARWRIDGAKRWVGRGDDADFLGVFAREGVTGSTRCFLVPRATPGVELRTIAGKTGLRIMQNSDISFHGVQVDDDARLRNINSWADVARCLRAMRADVAWIAVGAMAGAYEAALEYVIGRRQFGRSLARFQLLQEKIARMLGNLTAGLGMVVRLTEQQMQGIYRDEHSALVKMQTALLLRETAAMAREVCGGNGLLAENPVGRFHADAEAIYSYEGTHEINALIVGRAATGVGAFV